MADITPVTPGPDTSSPPAMMLSGGMQGPPPDVTQPMPNVTQQPDAAAMMSGQQPQQQPQPDPSTGAASDPAMVAAAHHHGRIGRAIDAVSKALGGSQTMRVVEQPDGSFVAQPMDSTPGERWSRIAKAALMGAAAGFANGQGRGGGAKAFAAGAQTGLAMPQQEQDQTMKKADDLEAQREKQILFKKNMAMLDLQYGKLNLENMRSSAVFDAAMAKSGDDQLKAVQGAHGKHLATYTDSSTLNDHMQANQELLDHMVGKGGTLVQIPKYANGKQVATEVYGIPEDRMNQFTEADQEIEARVIDPDLKGIHSEYTTMPKGTLNKDYFAALKKQQVDNGLTNQKFAELTTQRETADAAKQNAETNQKEVNSKIAENWGSAAEHQAAAAEKRDELSTGGKWKGTGFMDAATNRPIQENAKGERRVAPPAEGALSEVSGPALKDWRAKYQGPAVKADSAYTLLKTIVDRAAKGIKNPDSDLLALRMAMQQSAGINPSPQGGGRGGMDTNAMKLQMRQRGLADDKVNLIEQALDGSPIDQTQRNQILQSYSDYHRALWRTAVDEGRAIGIRPEDALTPNAIGRDKLLSEYGVTPQPTPQPGAGQGQGQQSQLPKPLPDLQKYPMKPGTNLQWDGEKYQPVQQ